ncbi:FusB/FusC family EF-G-binding protein [Bacillus spongiae]|uniref:FusB/FusC family EF-G-binding protein n=1 Tax=Bacillus spongiae TaxID=2683610 RepID=A0ABU8HGE7_9BACI
MDAFLTSDEYQFIKAQTKILVHGNSTVNDKSVLDALHSIAYDKGMNLFENITNEQKALLSPLLTITESLEAEAFLAKLKAYVIPFQHINEKTLKRLFPKVKKLKMPNLTELDFKEISYLGWNDAGTERKYIVAQHQGKLIGIKGSFKNSHKKGICTICNHHSKIGMFIVETKTSVKGTFTKKGNYICQDSHECNQNVTNLDKLHRFIEEMNND